MTTTGPPESKRWLAFAALVVGGAGASFWLPGLRATGGLWPAPLDDVYIHFDFARSIALGHPFEWLPGNGYSSGATSLSYPLLLAPGWLLGFRGATLGLFAAALAFACLVDLCRSLRAVLLGLRAPASLAWAVPLLVVAVPILDWSLFSGMETALFAAILGRALVAILEAPAAPPARRAGAQLRVGLWSALLVATRPESAPLALLLALSAAYDARSLSLVASLARAAGPTLSFLAAQAVANRALTGEWSAAGAVRKLVGSNPYASPIESAIEVIKNLVVLRTRALGEALGGPVASWIFPLLALVGFASPRARRLALPLVAGAYASLLLASLNVTARYQNLRYAAPTWLMLVAAALIGAASLAARRARSARVLGPVGLGLAIVAPIAGFPRQIDHFARASANIAGQQIEVARRLAARTPRPHRVLLGDAGAIPYFSGIDAIDGLGLGGYRGLPFARASVHGVPAVVELIERLPVADRPDVLALYPGWWTGLADVFGRRAFGVRIEDNVICGADEKVVYDADWSALAPPGELRAWSTEDAPGAAWRAIDEIDVADLVDERAHGYAFPSPHGGWVIGAVLRGEDGRPRFDGGRVLPEGRGESFLVAAGIDDGPAVLALRTDGGAEGRVRVAVEREGSLVCTADAAFPERPMDRWFELRVPIAELRSGDRVTVFAARGGYRSFHGWLLREGARRRLAAPPVGR